jgi:hypothetical protein
MPPLGPDHPGQQNTPPPSSQRDFSTGEGRFYLYHVWIKQRFDEGVIVKDKGYTPQERMVFLADWFRWLIEQKLLKPRQRLPPYASIASLFNLGKQDVAVVIRQLRDEKVLPPRKVRKDKGTSQWTDRDRFLWEYIGQMRAMRFDQVQRLAARQSEYEIENGLLSVSRTSELINRYTADDVRYAVFKSIFRRGPGWIYLTRRGLRQAGLTFRAEAPSVRSLEHLFWINEVRMHLEEEHPTMRWISERSIQAEQEKRKAGQKLTHIPDGILILPGGTDGKPLAIDIEVQVSKPSPGEVQEVMSDQFWSHGANRPLHYYVNRQSRGVVQSTCEKMVKERKAMRPSIEIIDLQTWQSVLSVSKRVS